MQHFLMEHGYARAQAGRRGVVSAHLAMMAHCCVNPNEQTYPYDFDGGTLFSTWLTTFACVLSKVCVSCELWLSGVLWRSCLYRS